MALQGLAAADGTGAGELLAKLGALFQVKNTSWLEVNLSGWVQNAPGQAVFDQIKTAIFQKVVIEFSYFGSSGRCTRRAVEPLKLIFKSKDWYLYGFCRLRKELRFFKLTRIKELSLSKEHFVREAPAEFSLNAQVKAEKLVSVQNAPPQKQAQNDFALFGGVKLAADRIGRKNRVIEKAAGTPEAGVYPCRFYCK